MNSISISCRCLDIENYRPTPQTAKTSAARPYMYQPRISRLLVGDVSSPWYFERLGCSSWSYSCISVQKYPEQTKVKHRKARDCRNIYIGVWRVSLHRCLEVGSFVGYRGRWCRKRAQQKSKWTSRQTVDCECAVYMSGRNNLIGTSTWLTTFLIGSCVCIWIASWMSIVSTLEASCDLLRALDCKCSHSMLVRPLPPVYS